MNPVVLQATGPRQSPAFDAELQKPFNMRRQARSQTVRLESRDSDTPTFDRMKNPQWKRKCQQPSLLGTTLSASRPQQVACTRLELAYNHCTSFSGHLLSMQMLTGHCLRVRDVHGQEALDDAKVAGQQLHNKFRRRQACSLLLPPPLEAITPCTC